MEFTAEIITTLSELWNGITVVHNIFQSPYSSLFGEDVKVGLRSTNLPGDYLKTIKNEDDLSENWNI